MVTGGVSSTPWLEVICLTLTSEIARYRNLPVDQGVSVTKVLEESPAKKAGLAVGDIILRIDRAVIYHVEDLQTELRNSKIGDKIRVSIYRRGREQYLDIELGKLP
jgi:serine protease Do